MLGRQQTVMADALEPSRQHMFECKMVSDPICFSVLAFVRTSAPEILVRAVVDRLDQLGIGSVAHLDGVQEKVGFPLPKGLG